MATSAKDGSERVAAAVMKDPVTREAVKHAGKESPSEVRASEAAATRTSDETSLRTSGQRRINLIWEITQAIVTVMVVGATLYIAGDLVLGGEEDDNNRAAAFLLLSNAFFMIVTAYYQRTNHVRTGGVGGKDVETNR